MSAHDWELIVAERARELRQQAERIHWNYLHITFSARYRTAHGRTACWEPPANVVETNESLWVILALAGVTAERVDVRLEGRDLVITGERPLPSCCSDGELKLWEIPLGRFERRLGSLSGEHPLSVEEVSFQEGLLLVQIRKHL
jgi:HSP20 family molecular chaperone IbpA